MTASPVEASRPLRPVDEIRADLEHPHTVALLALRAMRSSSSLSDGPIGRLLRDVEPLLAEVERLQGVSPRLADLHSTYLVERGHTLSTDGMERDEAIEAQALYVLGEAAELYQSCKGGTGGWGGVSKHTRCEIADVTLATVTLAKILDVTVEDCIDEKTVEDRGRG